MDVDQKTMKSNAAEDPRGESIAKVYVDAYLGAAGSETASATEEVISFVDDVLNSQSDFSRLLYGASIGPDEKIQLIDRIVASRATPRFTSFLKVLARHNRLSLLPTIRHVAQTEFERRSGKRRVSVTSAAELSDQTLDSIRSTLRSALAVEPILETRVDSTLVGGLVIRVGDTVYDGSLKTQIKQLRARLRERCLNEIQRGRDRFSHPEGN